MQVLISPVFTNNTQNLKFCLVVLEKIATMLNQKSYVHQSTACSEAGLQPAMPSQA